MNTVLSCRHEITLLPDSARVIVRPFIPGNVQILRAIIGRALSLSEEDVGRQWAAVRREFNERHFYIESVLHAHYEKVRKHIVSEKPLSLDRQQSSRPAIVLSPWRPLVRQL